MLTKRLLFIALFLFMTGCAQDQRVTEFARELEELAEISRGDDPFAEMTKKTNTLGSKLDVIREKGLGRSAMRESATKSLGAFSRATLTMAFIMELDTHLLVRDVEGNLWMEGAALDKNTQVRSIIFGLDLENVNKISLQEVLKQQLEIARREAAKVVAEVRK